MELVKKGSTSNWDLKGAAEVADIGGTKDNWYTSSYHYSFH